MVNRLLLAVTRQPDVASAWRSLVLPNDKIGIKISAAGGELFTTHRAIVEAIVDGLVAAGHPRSSIVVWDRELNGIAAAGYRPGAEGFRLLSIDPLRGFDNKSAFSAPLMGRLVWGDLEYKAENGAPLLSDKSNLSDVSHFSHILTSEVTKVINVPVMSSHSTSGLAGCLFNMTLPNIDNWRRFSDPDAYSDNSIAEIYSQPTIAKKVVLNIMDGLVAEYAGGPEAEPNFAVHYATLLASRDPVAVDSVALRQIEIWRDNAHVPPIGKKASYLQSASQLLLGNSDPRWIDVRNLSR